MRLQRLTDSRGAYTRGIAAVQQLADAGRKTTEILVRAGFIRTNDPLVPPPASTLISPRGHALRMALLVLFVAQVEKRPSPHVLRLPLSPLDKGTVAWADLIVSDARDGAGSAAKRPSEKRAASARKALKRLSAPDVALLELAQTTRRVGRFGELRLFEESGPRLIGDPVRYTRPTSTDETVRIPIDFFRRGWIFVLEDSEIATYLMYRYINAKNKVAFISAANRQDQYGIKTSAWEQHWLLTRSGILELVANENRRSDGTFTGQSEGAALEAHRFAVRDEALAEDAHSMVHAAVEERMSTVGGPT